MDNNLPFEAERAIYAFGRAFAVYVERLANHEPTNVFVAADGAGDDIEVILTAFFQQFGFD